MSYLTYNQSQLTNDIDKLVKNVLFKNLRGERLQDQLNKLYCPFMFMYYSQDSLNHSQNSLNYSQAINAFMNSTITLIGAEHHCDVIWDYDRAQKLIAKLSDYRDSIMRERYDWRYQESKNRKSLECYFKSLIENKSRVLVVFIELKYLKDQRHHVTISDFNHHMKKLRKLISKKKGCFKHITGYAWALEQGYRYGGFHCHLLLIYDNSKRYSDWYIAKTIGEKWQEVTEGVGTYHSSHDAETKHSFEKNGKLGIGRIHRNEPKEVENAFTVVNYLTKSEKYDQKLKVWLPKMQTLGHGKFKEK